MVRYSETAWQPGTLNAAVEEFLDAVASGSALDGQGRPYGPARARELRWCLEGQVADRLGLRPLAEITPDEIDSLVDELASDGLPKERLEAVVRSMRALYDHAGARGVVAQNPAARVALPAELEEAEPPRLPAMDRGISLAMQVASVVFVLLAVYFLAESL
jgi:hypothetical protein